MCARMLGTHAVAIEGLHLSACEDGRAGVSVRKYGDEGIHTLVIRVQGWWHVGPLGACALSPLPLPSSPPPPHALSLVGGGVAGGNALNSGSAGSWVQMHLASPSRLIYQHLSGQP